MGLDITAYRKLSPAPEAKRDQYGDVEDYKNYFDAHASSISFAEENWPGRTEGVTAGVYTFTELFTFHAGSYSGYNVWRDWLARVAGWNDAQECWDATVASINPFAELIEFADNEGVIGPKVAAKLAADFAANQAAAEKIGNDHQLQKYANWRKAFEMAADGGAVDFH